MITADLPELVDVDCGSLSPSRLLGVVAADDRPALEEGLRRARDVLAGRTVWNVNSTARGGGVAEMLQSLVPYGRGAGVDSRWVVIQGEPGFFAVTKRIHNMLHGSPGDGGVLDAEARSVYEDVTGVNAERLIARINEQDIVICHDPQTAGLVPQLLGRCAAVIWRCHVGVDNPNDVVRGAWDFLRPYVAPAAALIFSTTAFVWSGLDAERVHIVAPSIDPFAPKNYEIDGDSVRRILCAAGVEDVDNCGEAWFERASGERARVAHRSDITESTRITAATRLVSQVSRWDRLKDPLGVLRGFVEHVLPATDAHLVLAGPSVAQVADDPEGLAACREVQAAWQELPDDQQQRVHLVTLQMEDIEENAVVVNALQRRSAVVVQKSLAEGFGLTVAEAMWKARPVVASGIGGIRDQIEDGISGVLVDPADLAGFGAAVRGLLQDTDAADQMGERAQDRVRRAFLGSRHLLQYLEIMAPLIGAA